MLVVSDPLPVAFVVPQHAVQDLEGRPVVLVVDHFRAREIAPVRKSRRLLEVAGAFRLASATQKLGVS